jgi:hypothetical protein
VSNKGSNQTKEKVVPRQSPRKNNKPTPPVKTQSPQKTSPVKAPVKKENKGSISAMFAAQGSKKEKEKVFRTFHSVLMPNIVANHSLVMTFCFSRRTTL